MSRLGRGLGATGLVFLLGTAALWRGTDGFRAFTTESARRLEALRAPRPFPAVVLEDQDGRRFRLQDYGGRLLAVEFIYTRCGTSCIELSRAFQELRERLSPAAFGTEVTLLSISFDAARDDPARMRDYALAFDADGENWRIARPRDPADTNALLDAFGIVAIPDGRGGFEHNAALHLVGREGRLIQINGRDEVGPFLERIESLL